MQLKVVKKNAKGEQTSEINMTFNDFNEYVAFLEQIGIFIPMDDAAIEFLQGKAQYNLPLEV
jgi:hypothetical protein